MSIPELLLLSVSLAMDAFAVSVCKGIAAGKPRIRHALMCGLYFGGFQFLMPCIGYFAASSFEQYVRRFDHWIAFALLALIGINMIRESLDEQKEANASFSFLTMTALAVATSIDALAVGVSLAVLSVSVWRAAACIGVVTFVISFTGVYIGKAVGSRLAGSAGRAGGSILILLGLKILITDLFF